MVRYFINYEDFIENNVINKKITIYSPELFLIKKYKKKYYKFESVYNNSNLLNFVKTLNYNKKGVLMVELTEEEASKFDELLIKKYELFEDGIFKKVFDKKDRTISLINFDELINMSDDELSSGTVVSMMPCISNNNYMYISADRSFVSNKSLFDRRNILINKKIGSDIYFHTNSNELLDRYKNSITEVKEVDFHTYEIVKQRVFVLDSINSNDLLNLSSNNYYCLDILSKDAIPVYINGEETGYSLSLDKKDYLKKGYIINSIYLNKLLSDDSLKPLIDYINIYELESGSYKKKSLKSYLSDIKVLKYVRKTW